MQVKLLFKAISYEVTCSILKLVYGKYFVKIQIEFKLFWVEFNYLTFVTTIMDIRVSFIHSFIHSFIRSFVHSFTL